jgi:hypothetical protein
MSRAWDVVNVAASVATSKEDLYRNLTAGGIRCDRSWVNFQISLRSSVSAIMKSRSDLSRSAECIT